MKVVTFSLEQGNRYFGRVDGGPRFFIGSRVPYLGNKGLMNTTGTETQQYDRSAFREAYGFWVDFIHPTAMGEGKYHHTLNTYDAAHFTFAFLQFAAHVPNGDFVTYFRALLALPDAREYFPDLGLENGRIAKMVDGNVFALETDGSTEGLMDYFNPSPDEVEDTEIIQAAKMVHWVQNDPLHRDLQVKVGIAEFKKKMPTYARWYPMLNGNTPPICLMVADIHHQGRAKVATVLAALQSSDPLAALLRIGEPTYHERLSTLRREIKALTDDGTFADLKYDAGLNDFRAG